MLDMCKYNEASQHDSTTQVLYSLGSEERDITNMGLMTQQSEHASGFHLFTVAMTGHAKDKGVQLPQQVTDESVLS